MTFPEKNTLKEVFSTTTEQANAQALQHNNLHRYLKAATAPNTRKAYQSDVQHVMQAGIRLPASAEAILQYLRHFAEQLNPRTLQRRLTAIKQWHLCQGFPDPTAHPLVHKTMTGIYHVVE